MSANQIMKVHAAEVEQIGRELAINFDYPAQAIINAGFGRMGVERFTSAGDDLWLQIECVKNETQYNRPPRHLINRWKRY